MDADFGCNTSASIRVIRGLSVAISRKIELEFMNEPWERIHVAAEVNVDGFVEAGVADFEGRPHLFLSEGLDLDQPKARRRLGQTFFLLAIEPNSAGTFLREYGPLIAPVSGTFDPDWQTKIERAQALWTEFKRRCLGSATQALRVRGSFPAKQPQEPLVRWKVIRKRLIPIAEVRARLAQLDAIRAERPSTPVDQGSGDEQPF